MKYDHHLIREAKKCERLWVYRPFSQERYNFPLLLKMAGYARWEPGVTFLRTKSMEVFVEYVAHGSVNLVQDGKEYVVQAGEVYFLRKGVSHAYSVGQGGRLLKRFVQIGGTNVNHHLQSLGLWEQDYIRPQEPRKIERVFKMMTTALSNSPLNGDRELHVTLSGLTYQLLLELSLSLKSSIPVLIENALTFMHENLHRSLSRQEICEHLGISMPYFNRLFSYHMKCTPVAYFLRQKFNWAAQLLRSETLSIKEISYTTGFDDPLYFSAQFKKQFGVSPTQYRKRQI
ncbi:hypothetical protein CSA56_12095, partial [candidate division KSB3 bacterium]